jgi:hypothetical protein
MRTIVTACGILLLCASAQAQTAERPAVQVGDTWTYRQATETHAGFKEEREVYDVTRTTASSIYFDARQAGSSQPPKNLFTGPDWRRIRAVNGVETVVNQPFDFPLAAGKHWDLHYREDHPNKGHAWEDFSLTYTVAGIEQVEVPAGKFDAIKVEAEGHWLAEVAPSSTVAMAAQGTSGNAAIATQVNTATAHRAEGRVYKAFWYVPAVRRWVKSVEEFYSSGGERSERTTTELESYQLK